MGLKIGRNVTILRLHDGRLVIHSTAPFSSSDVSVIKSLGAPGWIVEGSLFHDSFAQEGSRAFSGVPYLAPARFTEVTQVASTPLTQPPPEWADQLDVLRLDGVRANEHVFFHRVSRTLIVCDLLFNFGRNVPASTKWVARHVMRLRDGIGMSAFFRLTIRDRGAFEQSLRRMMRWDFERIIVGHGDVISADAKRSAAAHFAKAGFDIG